MTADNVTALLAGILSATVALTAASLTQRRANRERVDAVNRAEKERDAALERLDLAQTREDERHRLDLSQSRTRLITERFGRAAEQLGSGEPPVRLAGVYAMASLADEWGEQRQQCVDVLCAYLRLPVRQEEGEGEVRSTVVAVMAEHLQPVADPGWRNLAFDFRSAVLPRGRAGFDGAVFDGRALFAGARFEGQARFQGASFAQRAGFDGAVFGEGAVFQAASFDGHASFIDAVFAEDAAFDNAQFHQNAVFDGAEFLRAARFGYTRWSRFAKFVGCRFSGPAQFGTARFEAPVSFERAEFGGTTSFRRAEFAFTGDVRFDRLALRQPMDLTVADVPGGVVPSWHWPDGTATTSRRLIKANAATDLPEA